MTLHCPCCGHLQMVHTVQSRTETSGLLDSPYKLGWASRRMLAAWGFLSTASGWCLGNLSPPATQIWLVPRNSWVNTMRFPYNNDSVVFQATIGLTMIQYLIFTENGQIGVSTPTRAHLKMYNYTPACSQKDLRYLCTCEIKLKLVLPF